MKGASCQFRAYCFLECQPVIVAELFAHLRYICAYFLCIARKYNCICGLGLGFHNFFGQDHVIVGKFIISLAIPNATLGLGELCWHKFEHGRQINVSIIEHNGCV